MSYRVLWELVSLVKSVILTFLIIPILIVIAVRNPEAAGHFVAVVVTAGARLLAGTAGFFGSLLGGKTA